MEIHYFSHFLAAIRKILSRGPPKSKHITSSQQLCRSSSESLFSVEQKVWSVKTQLSEMLEQKGTSGDGEALTSIEINLLKMVISKLTLLNREAIYLFEEGALTLYEDFCGLIKSCTQDKIREGVKDLLKEIGERLKNLLLQYFIYQQYLSRKQNPDCGPQLHHQLSHQECTNSGSEDFHDDSGLIQQIEKQVLGTPVHLLITKQVRDYQRKMSEAAEVCRICFNKVLLRNVKQHVRGCQKRNILKQNIEEKKYELTQLKVSLKGKCEEINLKDTMTQYDEAFKKISRIILSFDKGDRYINRRCSMVAGRSDRHTADIKKLIQEFLENHGEDLLLKKIEKTYREKTYLEKQINQIEMSSLHCKENDNYEEKENSSEQSSVKLSNFSIKPKTTYEKDKEKQGKRLAKKQTQEKLSNNSIELSQSQHSENKIDPPLFEMRKLKRCLTKDFEVHEDYEPLDNIKQHSSFQVIIEESDNQEISLNNFQILKVLGQGAFGKVYLVRRKETKDIYALKIIKIPENNTQSSIQSIKRQHEIFKKIAGQHLVKAPFSFSEKNCHVFILEYLPGGDLRKMLNEQVYFQEERAKVYLAEIVLAIEHLHVFDIIHRDLKPQNLVFDKTGHLKLTDFGLSQFQMKEKLEKSRKQEIEKQTKKTRRRREAVLSNNKQKMKLIGTPDYIAPQIIFKTSLNNFSIDWWSLGVMAYELMIGARPFCAETIQEVIDNITNFNIEWPEIGYEEGMISPQAKDFICQLLNKDFMHRLGAEGVQSIKDHPFFASINWETIKSTRRVAIPKIINLKDCMEFRQDLGLKREIAQFIQKGEKKRTVDLQNFVRFDLLGTETIQSFQKIHEEQKKKLRTLKSLQQNFLMEDCQSDA